VRRRILLLVWFHGRLLKHVLGIPSISKLRFCPRGYGCADSYHPGVYARISEEIEWIQGVVCDTTPSSCYQMGETVTAGELKGEASLSGSASRIQSMNSASRAEKYLSGRSSMTDSPFITFLINLSIKICQGLGVERM